MGHQAVLVGTCDHGGGAHAGLPVQQRLDLAELEPVAAQFDLVVEASDDLDTEAGHQSAHVAGPVARPVAGSAEAGAALVQFGQIAEGDAGAADQHLARAPRRQRRPSPSTTVSVFRPRPVPTGTEEHRSSTAAPSGRHEAPTVVSVGP